ncbi:P1 family peptidase [Sporolactobacillus shoreicorticis]|uniref:P1 family peptidase n=1 Tax=Sporolactobacillus shoreicorticis TaxID=1923877 RepID=A0ABW5S1T2_9BACL|nr:P1 family peptidase [Sporolactobacillus shoreicorticis]
MTDVFGVTVGHTTISSDKVKTGMTAICLSRTICF